jgi:hypothetical protein
MERAPVNRSADLEFIDEKAADLAFAFETDQTKTVIIKRHE